MDDDSKYKIIGSPVTRVDAFDKVTGRTRYAADYNIKVGKKIDVYVESVDPEKRRMSLGLVLKEKPVGYK